MTETEITHAIDGSVFNDNLDGYIKCDRDLVVITANHKARELLKTKEASIVDQSLENLLPQSAAQPLVVNTALLDEETPLKVELFLSNHDEWFEAILYPSPNNTITICLRDITDHKRTQQSLQASELRFRTMLESVVDGVILIDEGGTILQCNNATIELFGYEANELIGRNVSILMQTNDRDNHDQYIRAHLTTGKSSIIGVGREVMGQRKDLSTFPLDLAINKFLLNGQSYFVGTMRDVTDKKNSEKEIKQLNAELEQRITRRNQQLKTINKRLEQLAMHDHLTGLPNRALFQKKLRNGIQSADLSEQSLILIMLDLDNFKEINDTLGHDIGDELLKSVSHRITKLLRTSDTVARLGGDEFGIILMRTDSAGAAIVADNILKALDPPFEIKEHNLSMKASLGIAVYREHGDTEALLMRYADVAMYEAKRNNIGYAFYDASSDPHKTDRLTLLSQLRLALSNNELQLYYQPKVDLTLDKSTGVEALLRWHHEEKGMIPPDEFVPIAEQAGLIKPLTYWVIETALRQYSHWSKQGLDLSIAVNLSAKNLDDDDLPTIIAEKLNNWSVPPAQLILEITETSIISDPAKALEVLTRLDDMGITLSIDDYGTGYSSLAYVKKLPIDEIKIDRSFVANILRDPDDTVIVKSTIDLAHSLGMRIVAEGVEDKETADLLCKLKCDYVQGYYFSRPLPVEQTTEWFEQTAHKSQTTEPA